MTPERLHEIQERFRANGTLSRVEIEELIQATSDPVRVVSDGISIRAVALKEGTILTLKASSWNVLEAVLAESVRIAKEIEPAKLVVLAPDVQLESLDAHDLAAIGLQRIPT